MDGEGALERGRFYCYLELLGGSDLLFLLFALTISTLMFVVFCVLCIALPVAECTLWILQEGRKERKGRSLGCEKHTNEKISSSLFPLLPARRFCFGRFVSACHSCSLTFYLEGEIALGYFCEVVDEIVIVARGDGNL